MVRISPRLRAALVAAGLLVGATTLPTCDWTTEPCLSPWDAAELDAGLDAHFDGAAASVEPRDRAEALERLSDRLPADVLDRLDEPSE